jgi:hypothetical protein
LGCCALKKSRARRSARGPEFHALHSFCGISQWALDWQKSDPPPSICAVKNLRPTAAGSSRAVTDKLVIMHENTAPKITKQELFEEFFTSF